MTHFDAFNGDADGLCSLHQLRLADPRDSALVSGPKRDIALLQRIDAEAGDTVTALDISYAVNRDAAAVLLARGVRVDYFDHHFAGEIPVHPLLHTTIDPSPECCTGILVDRFLGGRHRIWAVVAAYGDNLAGPARRLGESLALTETRHEDLRRLGEALAYNGYGDGDEDLIIHPIALYRILQAYADPFEFIRDEPIIRHIDESRRSDLERAWQAVPLHATTGATVHVLPDDASSRRVRGAFANALANREAAAAHAVLTSNDRDTYTVSLRTPRGGATSADSLCRQFPTGGGRAIAAGIDDLPRDRLTEFIDRLDRLFP